MELASLGARVTVGRFVLLACVLHLFVCVCLHLCQRMVVASGPCFLSGKSMRVSSSDICWKKCYSKPVLVLMHQVHKRTSSQRFRGKGSSKAIKRVLGSTKVEIISQGKRESKTCGNNLGHATKKGSRRGS